MLRRRKKRPFVSGIHDYCDRWCERCTLSSRCLNFVIERKLREKMKDHFTDEFTSIEDIPLDQLHDMIGSETEMIEELARELGVSVEDLAWMDELDGLREELEGSEGDEVDDEAMLALYEEDAYNCFCIYERLIDEYQETLCPLIDAIEEDPAESARAERIDEALTEVNWYLDLMYAKLKRAYYAMFLYTSKGYREGLTDANGSAKVVMISLDASRRAWQVLRDELPGYQQEITWMLAILEQIYLDVQHYFPKARSFKRPGFDK
jgi:hypothetical protein